MLYVNKYFYYHKAELIELLRLYLRDIYFERSTKTAVNYFVLLVLPYMKP